MLNQLWQLFKTLTAAQRKRLYFLQVLITLTSLFELIGISSVAPFMAALTDPGIIHNKEAFQIVYTYLGFTSDQNFIIFLGLSILVIMAIGNSISMLTTYLTSKTGFDLGAEVSTSIFNYYLKQDYLFHVYNNSSKLISNIQNEIRRITDNIIFRALYFNSRFFTILFIGFGLLVLNPTITISVAVLLGICYMLVFRLMRKKLLSNGILISENVELRAKVMNEALSGVKELKVLGNEHTFLKEFKTATDKFSHGQTMNEVLGIAPRYVLEVVAFTCFILIALSFYLSNTQLSTTLPVLSIYAMGGFKLMPALQQSFYALAMIRGSINAFETLKPDLQNAKSLEEQPLRQVPALDFKNYLQLKNIFFKYPQADKNVLNGLDLKISKNTTVAFVGASGSGKTTTIDLILGLLQPSAGMIFLDEQALTAELIPAWHKNIGYVPQQVYLADRSLAENIAFGEATENIDMKQVEKAARLANIHEFILTLEKAYETTVGERGVQLSGGQRQRIGIARALYRKVSVLVLDEATSALDGVTEAAIIDSINNLSHSMTIIIIAHRLSTVKKADQIFYLESGRLIDQGDFEQLLSKNEKFRNLAHQ